MAAPLPDLEGPLEPGDSAGEEMGEGDSLDMTGELDPQFAADAAEAFPDLDDKGLTALQRAIQGLIGR
jgi:hypothetical protein